MEESPLGHVQELFFNRSFLLFGAILVLGEVGLQLIKLKRPSVGVYTALRLLFLLVLLTSLTLWAIGPLRDYLLTSLYRTEFVSSLVKSVVGFGTATLSALEALEIRRYERGS